MKPAFLLIILTAAPSQVTVVDGFVNGDGYTWRNGNWWKSGIAFQRVRSIRYCYGRPCFTYRPIAQVTINNRTITAQTADWKTEIVKLASREKENQYFLDALQSLNLGNNFRSQYSRSYNGSGVQGSTVYGYNRNMIQDLYGDNNASLLYQQSARLAEGAQNYAQDATSAFADLLSKDAEARARAAEIFAAGLAVREARSGGSRTITQERSTVTVPPTSRTQQQQAPPSAGPEPGSGLKGPGGMPLSVSKCMKCHMKGREKDGNGFVLMMDEKTPRKLDPLELLVVLQKVRKQPDEEGAMPPKPNPPLTDEEAADWVDWIGIKTRELKPVK